MFATEWLTLPSSRLITLTLLHFLWQGLAVVLLLQFFVEACRIRRAGARYACSLVALLAMVVAPVVTLGILMAGRLDVAGHGFGAFESADASPPVVVSFSAFWLQMAEPHLLAAWLCGVAVFGSRLLSGAVGVARLRRSCVPIPAKLRGVVEELGKQLRMDAQTLVYLSEQVTDAMAVGLVRPLVLIPAAWVTEMPLEMLEAVIAHELAHLARRDLWVNLLQRIVETVLFYHPAVWWLSRRLRMERELCADDLAVQATGKRLEYAQALEQIAGERLADIRPALAAFLRGENEMRLLQRVRNVLKQTPEERSRLWPAGLAALALPLGLWAAAAWNNSAVADDEREAALKAANDATFVRRAYLDLYGRMPQPEELRVFLVNDEGDDDNRGDDEKPRIKRERAERDEAKRAAERQERDKKEAEKRATVEKERSRWLSENSNRDGKKPELAEVREERYTIIRDGKAEQIVDKVIMTKDGKPVTVVVPREQREAANDHRLDELTTLVKQLSRNVERLQDEVSNLRAQKQSEPSYRIRRDDEERSSLERSKRELQEDIDRAALAKHRASEKAEAEARAAKQQAEAARRAVTDQKEASERKLRRVEEEKRSSPEPREAKERTRGEPGRSDGERDLLPKRRESSNSNSREGDEQSQLDLRRRELKQAQEQLDTFRRQVVDREKHLYELAKEQGEGTGQRVQKEIRQKLEAEDQEIAKRAAKEKELAAAAKEIEASRQRAEAARRAIEDQIRKLKEDATGDKGSEERQAIEQKLNKLRGEVNEIEATDAKTEPKRKLIDQQLRKLKEEKERDTSATERKREAEQHGASELRELQSRVIANQPGVNEALPRFRDLKPGTIIDLRSNQGLLGEKISAERRLKRLQDNDTFQLDFTDNPELEAKTRKELVGEQALLTGPGLQPKPAARPGAAR